jgi:uncharacterized protein YndB with AHSA1/START domain
MSTPDLAPLRLERSFAATPEEVFDAWTNPSVLERWSGPAPNWSSPGCEVDLRVGGGYVLRIRDPETGAVHVVRGEYREIDRPRRLVYTWYWAGAEGAPEPHVSVVSVEFIDAGQKTTVVLEHSGLESDESRARHGAGWAGALDNLSRRVFGEQA